MQAQRRKNIVGDRYGILTVLSFSGISKANGGAIWLCKCDCGKEKPMTRNVLIQAQSCGCLRKKIIHGHATKKSMTSEYYSWRSMIQRCTNPNCLKFKHYGGRGITVCERWRNSFVAFLEDMGKKPTKKHTIDRIENDGNYEPSNCRWITRLEQASNTSTSVKLLNLLTGIYYDSINEAARSIGVSKTDRARIYSVNNGNDFVRI